MAKGSSARKVARVAASSGGARARKQRNLMFPIAISLIVAAGLLLVIFARGNNQSASANNTPPRASIDPAKVITARKSIPSLQHGRRFSLVDPAASPEHLHLVRGSA